jgi:uncharacterized pyridoxal phosphate-containing UPF0001 family protein
MTMEISAGLVKELREKTGAGMMACKKALSETGGDFEKAIECGSTSVRVGTSIFGTRAPKK